MAITTTPAKKAPRPPWAAPKKPAVVISEAHAADLKLIADKMCEVATKNNFCSVYDKAVADLNSKLSVPLPTPAGVLGYLYVHLGDGNRVRFPGKKSGSYGTLTVDAAFKADMKQAIADVFTKHGVAAPAVSVSV